MTNAEKNRLVLDLRFVNSLLKSYQFKYEDLRTFRDIFEAGDWFFKFDYQSGYHHVDILPQHQQYLAFTWGEGNAKRYFVFTVLPFGLATAPYVFTKIQKALVKHWRAQGFRIFTYLDDGIGGGPTKETGKFPRKEKFPEKSEQTSKAVGFCGILRKRSGNHPKRGKYWVL